MKTLAELKKEFKEFKSCTLKYILVDEETAEIVAVVTDTYGNIDTEFISLGDFDTEKNAMKRAKLIGTKLNLKIEVANC